MIAVDGGGGGDGGGGEAEGENVRLPIAFALMELAEKIQAAICLAAMKDQ